MLRIRREAFSRLTFPDVHHPFDPRLEAPLLPSVEKVTAAARTLVKGAG